MSAGLAVQPPEQLRYARLLDWGTRIGLVVLVTSFAAYVLGLAESHVPREQLPQLWEHPVGRYLELTGSPTGWGWLALVHRGAIPGLAHPRRLLGAGAAGAGAAVPAARRSRVRGAVRGRGRRGRAGRLGRAGRRALTMSAAFARPRPAARSAG